MLSRLSLENFKSWRKLEAVRLAPVTALFGANSSGKGSVLQFLLLLKQTKEATDRSLVLDFGNLEKYADLGSFQDAVFNHDDETSLSWRMDWHLPETISVTDPLESRRSVRFRGDEMSLEAGGAN